MLLVERLPSADCPVVKLSGSMTIGNIKTVHLTLCTALETKSVNLYIDMTDVVELDLSFLQLILSLERISAPETLLTICNTHGHGKLHDAAAILGIELPIELSPGAIP